MLTINSSRRQWCIYCLGRYCLADISLLLLCIIVKKCVVIRSILSSIGLLLDLAFHFLCVQETHQIARNEKYVFSAQKK